METNDLKELDIHMTNRCNMSCRHCVFSSGSRTINELDFSALSKLIKNFATVNSNGKINLFGGEALLRQDTFGIIDLAHDLGLTVGLTTNGRASKDTIRGLLKKNISRITIDLDGGEPTTHDWLRFKEGDFGRSVEVIRLFISSGTYTAVNSVLLRNNIGETTKILCLCEELNVNAVAFYYFTPIGRGEKLTSLMVDPREWILARNSVIGWINEHEPHFDIVWERAYELKTLEVNFRKWRCGTEHSETLFVRCDGEVYPCALLENTTCSLGNIRRDHLITLLQRRKRFGFEKEGVCPALAYHLNGNINGPDPRPSDGLIYPSCPYDYQILSKEKNFHEKYASYQ